MKILHLSDTHGMHRRLDNLPEADLVVHAGDFTMNGSEAEAIDFMNWFCDLPYAHKLFICGNHDECLYGARIDGLDANVTYLCNSGVRIGGLAFYGVPMFMHDCVDGQQLKNYEHIPEDTDVLITHCPPLGILDEDGSIYYGSPELRERIARVRPRMHLFGHIHKQHGMLQEGNTLFCNGAIMDESYERLRRPLVIELPEGKGGW